ncbi:MAG: 4-hydroxythreonine-4-phosphate dehydrogenase PdxA [Pseudomonadota bacterium]|jgi:4-hydroxythreonine-4-phosphate dehydrogenase
MAARDNAVPARIAITTGEPAGIGPEVAVKALAQFSSAAQCALIGDVELLATRARRYAPSLVLQNMQPFQWADEGLTVWHVPLTAPASAGTLDPRNAAYVLRTLDLAIEAATSCAADAMVTCPISKSVINDAGVAFSGHTEYLAAKTSTAQVVMMLAAGAQADSLRVALATTHLPLKAVPAALTISGLVQTLQIIAADLKSKFGIATPRIAVCGLNPHAGEGGYLGREEIEVIAPAIQKAQVAGIDATGPYPADTVFAPHILKHVDCVLAMYHDQGLPTLKYASFGHGINITLGLPIIRTSVDHGTALDIAGKGVADCGSLLIALACAVQMVGSRKSAHA